MGSFKPYLLNALLVEQVLFWDLKLVLNKTERILLTKPFLSGRGDKEKTSKEINTVIVDNSKCQDENKTTMS